MFVLLGLSSFFKAFFIFCIKNKNNNIIQIGFSIIINIKYLKKSYNIKN